MAQDEALAQRVKTLEEEVMKLRSAEAEQAVAVATLSTTVKIVGALLGLLIPILSAVLLKVLG